MLAIGPVTNVATVVKNHPELANQIDEVVVCAGRTPGFPFRPGLEKVTVGDYNFERDPEAFRVLFDAGIRVVLSGFECSSYRCWAKRILTLWPILPTRATSGFIRRNYGPGRSGPKRCSAWKASFRMT